MEVCADRPYMLVTVTRMVGGTSGLPLGSIGINTLFTAFLLIVNNKTSVR